MSEVVIKVENLSKQYRLGGIGTGTLSHDLNRLWASIRGKEDPYLQIGETNNRTKKSNNDYVWALKNLNFEVNQGDVLGIIGRNGAGKSTLLKILSQITKPSTGSVKMKGRIGSLLEVGTGFHPDLSGRENIFINGAILGMRKWEIEKRLDEIINFAGVERFIDTPVKRYSSGMLVRLGFSVAAHLEPEILIVDEVLAVGDAEFQKKCLGKMGEVSKNEGRTILFVSHNMNAIQQLCSRGLLLSEGSIEFESSVTSSLVSKYFENNSDIVESKILDLKKNPYFQLTSVRFKNRDESPSATIVSRTSNLILCLEANVENLDPSLTIGYCIYNEEGQSLYWSYHTDEKQDLWPNLKIGKNRICTKIPTEILNEGQYYIEVIGGLNFRSWLYKPGEGIGRLSFIIQGGLSLSPLYLTKRPTLIAPIIKWSSEDV